MQGYQQLHNANETSPLVSSLPISIPSRSSLAGVFGANFLLNASITLNEFLLTSAIGPLALPITALSRLGLAALTIFMHSTIGAKFGPKDNIVFIAIDNLNLVFGLSALLTNLELLVAKTADINLDNNYFTWTSLAIKIAIIAAYQTGDAIFSGKNISLVHQHNLATKSDYRNLVKGPIGPYAKNKAREIASNFKKAPTLQTTAISAASSVVAGLALFSGLFKIPYAGLVLPGFEVAASLVGHAHYLKGNRGSIPSEVMSLFSNALRAYGVKSVPSLFAGFGTAARIVTFGVFTTLGSLTNGLGTNVGATLRKEAHDISASISTPRSGSAA